MDIQKMLQQAQQAQFKIQEMQEKFKDIDVQGEAGGGLVKVTMNCAGNISALIIDSSIISSDDKETMEDLIIAAINNATQTKDDRIEEETKKVVGDMGLPDGAKLPF
ncbi:MAG: YbaB/EbfC family nucleoid-associated protein [Alphaproteobacteria bacterium]|nr:YbaB/EbfC family nucleoid-associated protein [Alphaproteobacteria bacterium]